jgi:hypothetical protein
MLLTQDIQARPPEKPLPTYINRGPRALSRVQSMLSKSLLWQSWEERVWLIWTEKGVYFVVY